MYRLSDIFDEKYSTVLSDYNNIKYKPIDYVLMLCTIGRRRYTLKNRGIDLLSSSDDHC